jgi:hypothetical protein
MISDSLKRRERDREMWSSHFGAPKTQKGIHIYFEKS